MNPPKKSKRKVKRKIAKATAISTTRSRRSRKVKSFGNLVLACCYWCCCIYVRLKLATNTTKRSLASDLYSQNVVVFYRLFPFS